jgi:hypothetical protein
MESPEVCVIIVYQECPHVNAFGAAMTHFAD